MNIGDLVRLGTPSNPYLGIIISRSQIFSTGEYYDVLFFDSNLGLVFNLPHDALEVICK